ncbi:hypothetical protein OB13_00420 [Pontibacter sp. HJ8]
MKKETVIGLLVFLLGIGVAVLLESNLRIFIQNLYRNLSGQVIYFTGKDFNLFASPFYYFGFGFLILALWVGTSKTGFKGNLTFWLLTVITFLVALIIITYIDINFKLAECTACTDGRRGLRYNDINYDFTIVLSIVVALIPSIVRIRAKRKMPSPNHV